MELMRQSPLIHLAVDEITVQVINPFDFVSVDNINNSTSIGIIKDIHSVGLFLLLIYLSYNVYTKYHS